MSGENVELRKEEDSEQRDEKMDTACSPGEPGFTTDNRRW